MKISTTTFNIWNEYDNQKIMVGPPSRTNFVDGVKNPSLWGSLPVPQVLIKLVNFWYGKPDGIMDPLPF